MIDVPAIHAYTTAVLRARYAYAADRLVEAGICVTCQTRRIDPLHRECWGCRKTKKDTT